MPVPPPILDDRKAADILGELVRRIPSHTPEWTNHGRSDPGITLLELFAFMGESLLYRMNQIPERNRKKFLSLLGVQQDPGAPAVGVVQFAHERPEIEVVEVGDKLALTAGEVPFWMEGAIDVLPLEGKVLYKQEVAVDDRTRQRYELLHAPQDGTKRLVLYRTCTLSGEDVQVADAADRSLWIALLVPAKIRLLKSPTDAVTACQDFVVGKKLTIGLAAPGSDTTDTRTITALPPGLNVIAFSRGQAVGSSLPPDPDWNQVTATSLPSNPDLPGMNLLTVTLPRLARRALPPTQEGSGPFVPPPLTPEDAKWLVGWLRLRIPENVEWSIRWMGINAAPIRQGKHWASQEVGQGTGEPDQRLVLKNVPVLPGSLILTSGPRDLKNDRSRQTWRCVDDLYTLPRQGTTTAWGGDAFGCTLDSASGEVQFGDGFHGARPPPKASIWATYTSMHGVAGNLQPIAASTKERSAANLRLTLPVGTWGGRAPETIEAAERRATSSLRHGNRAVTKQDFEEIARNTPGVRLAQVVVFPGASPEVTSDHSTPPKKTETGALKPDAGHVTLLAVPQTASTDAPNSSGEDERVNIVRAAIEAELAPRRLVGTELHVRTPSWVQVSISITLRPDGADSSAMFRAVEKAIRQHLRPGWAPRLAEPRALTVQELRDVAASIVGPGRVLKVLLGGSAALLSENNVVLNENDVVLKELQLPLVGTVQLHLEGDSTTPAELGHTASTYLVPLNAGGCS